MFRRTDTDGMAEVRGRRLVFIFIIFSFGYLYCFYILPVKTVSGQEL